MFSISEKIMRFRQPSHLWMQKDHLLTNRKASGRFLIFCLVFLVGGRGRGEGRRVAWGMFQQWVINCIITEFWLPVRLRISSIYEEHNPWSHWTEKKKTKHLLWRASTIELCKTFKSLYTDNNRIYQTQSPLKIVHSWY